jgi:hypothetical protein
VILSDRDGDQKTTKPPVQRKNVTDKVIDALTSTDVLDKIMPVLTQTITETIVPSRKSPTELRRRICLPSCIWVAGKSLGLSGNGLLFDLGVSFIAIDLEPEFKSTSSLLFCFIHIS